MWACLQKNLACVLLSSLAPVSTLPGHDVPLVPPLLGPVYTSSGETF